jgi:hypothetical protein
MEEGTMLSRRVNIFLVFLTFFLLITILASLKTDEYSNYRAAAQNTFDNFIYFPLVAGPPFVPFINGDLNKVISDGQNMAQFQDSTLLLQQAHLHHLMEETG